MPDFTEQQLAKLIAALPPAPAAWERAAQQLPAAREAIDTLVQRAQADARQRQRILDELVASLSAEGVEPQRSFVEELKARLADEQQ